MSPEISPESLQHALFDDKVRQAREMSARDKFMAGAELFDLACDIARAGIQAQNPELDEAGVEGALQERIKLARRLER